MLELAKLTGEVKDFHIEVMTKMGTRRFCRPIFAFPLLARPSTAWVNKYKDKFFAAITHEINNPEKVLFIGLVPMESNGLPEEGVDDNVFLLSEKFRLWFNDEENKTVWDSLDGGELLLGDKNATEHALLGDKTIQWLEDLSDQVMDLADQCALITVPTVVGPSGVPINAAAFNTISLSVSALQGQLNTLLSELVKLK